MFFNMFFFNYSYYSQMGYCIVLPTFDIISNQVDLNCDKIFRSCDAEDGDVCECWRWRGGARPWGPCEGSPQKPKEKRIWNDMLMILRLYADDMLLFCFKNKL